MRAVLGTICTICEAKLYDTVRIKINNRVARYMLFMLLANAGMWNASTSESLVYPASFGLTIRKFDPFSTSSLIVCDVYHDACAISRVHTTQQPG